jgi:hypothetical protein
MSCLRFFELRPTILQVPDAGCQAKIQIIPVDMQDFSILMKKGIILKKGIPPFQD